MISLVSCSFNYNEAGIEESLDDNVPDIILKNAKMVFVRGTSVTIESDYVEIYSNQAQQNMFDVTFREEDKEGDIRMEGEVSQVTIDTETNNITMVGEVFARSNTDETEITTEYLYWNDEERIMEGSTVFPVTITKDIGSSISGYGFIGNADSRELTISGNVKGQLVVDE